MPKATDNRKPVGTLHCDDCGTVASYYQVQKGKRRGYLYKRCGCGCDQSSGVEKQRRWLSGMNLTGEPMIDHPLDLQVNQTEEEEKAASAVNTGVEPESVGTVEPNRGGKKVVGLLALIGAIGLALVS